MVLSWKELAQVLSWKTKGKKGLDIRVGVPEADVRSSGSIREQEGQCHGHLYPLVEFTQERWNGRWASWVPRAEEGQSTLHLLKMDHFVLLSSPFFSLISRPHKILHAESIQYNPPV